MISMHYKGQRDRSVASVVFILRAVGGKTVERGTTRTQTNRYMHSEC